MNQSSFTIALVSAMIIALPLSDTKAQEVDGASAYLAMQCAASSGKPMEGYLDYARKLELTISLLSPEQQARVFGAELGTAHNAVNRAGKTNSSGGGSASQTELPAEEEETLLDRLTSWITG